MRYFPSWVESEYYKVGNERAVELAYYQDTFNVMFAGNIGEAQDFPAILGAAEAARDISDLRWFIIGSGRALDWVRQEISVRRLQDRVVLLGRHPTERMPSFFRAADALLVSLKKEPVFSMTVPGKLQNYLASGVPVLAMLDGEGARVVNESGGGLTSPAGDGFALAQSVRQLKAMTEVDRRAMGRRGQDYCRREFGRDILMSRLEGWMAEVSRSTAG
ncbi:glycosyltransferase family 4 protein [Kaistia sp. UC242_56]|uniref:glycosyltransferase family 4 protein n=1 Tax=Kaistia sp. UC242_56 TaxID=3374625 RepID=UPI0037A59CD4